MAGGTDTIELVAAVSNAGGLGIFGALLTPPDELRSAIRAIRSRTDRPFGVNVIAHRAEVTQADTTALQAVLDTLRPELGLPPGPAAVQSPPAVLAEQVRVICEEQVPVLNPMGDPVELIGPAHEAGVTVMGFVTTVAEAEAAVEAGVDVIVAQGAEAGGLRASYRLDGQGEAALIGTMALVPQVVDAVPSAVPVVVAGGIMDGRGVVAALALGASGVMLGTRFSLARESGIAPSWRARLLAARETDAVVSRTVTGRPARSIRNRLVEAQLAAGVTPLPFPFQFLAAADIHRAAAEQGNAELTYLAAGQGLPLATDGPGAADIVAELVAEAEADLARLSHRAMAERS